MFTLIQPIERSYSNGRLWRWKRAPKGGIGEWTEDWRRRTYLPVKDASQMYVSETKEIQDRLKREEREYDVRDAPKPFLNFVKCLCRAPTTALLYIDIRGASCISTSIFGFFERNVRCVEMNEDG